MSGPPGTPATEAGATSAEQQTRPRRARRLRWLLEVALVLLVYFAVSTWREKDLLTAGTDLAPELALLDLDGHEVKLSDLRGKSVMIQFWATWCGVCRQEFGALNAVSRGLGPDQAMLTVVADGDDRERIRAFASEHELEYPILLGNEAALRAYHVGAFPTTYFVDPSGRVAGHTVGMSTRWGLSRRLGCARR